jgi:ribonuclease Y
MLALAQLTPTFWTSTNVLLLTGLSGIVAGGLGIYAISWLRAGGAVVRARKVIADANEQAERVKKDAEVAAKEEFIKRHEALEAEGNTQRAELREAEKRLTKREDGLEHKLDLLNKKENYVESLERSVAAKRKELNAEQAELERLMEQEKITLHKLSELTREEAQQLLMRRLEG